MNKTFCKKCDHEEKFELIHIIEDYVAHGKCRNCQEYVLKQLNKQSIFKDFANLRDNHTDEQLKLLLKKGGFCMSTCQVGKSLKKRSEILTPKKAFHSNLNMSDIRNHDYEHVQKVWKEFKLKNLGE